MSSRCRDAVTAIAVALCAAAACAQQPLRVCADPDNPPLSQRDGSGVENRIAQLLAEDLGRPLEFAWLRDRRGFVRKTMGAGLCELIVGVPVGDARVATTRPYYRSAFYTVRRGADAPVTLDDPRLPDLRIGVQLVGGEGFSPVGHALVVRGAIEHVVGYTLASDDRPPAQRMAQAVADGELDAALVWGPLAGWWVRRSAVPLAMTRVQPPADLAALPFAVAIAMGVRRGDSALQRTVDDFIVRRQGDIDALLDAYAVPRVAP